MSSSRRIAFAVSLVALVASMLAVVPPASAATIAVNCPGTNLQTKINAAPNGSTLLISGTCTGNFTISKNLTLKGSPMGTLDANGSGRVLHLVGAITVKLDHMKVTGGNEPTGGAGILQEGGSLTVLDSVITGNETSGNNSGGAAIQNSGGNLRIDSSTISNNSSLVSTSGSVGMYGGAVYAIGKVTILNSTFRANEAVSVSSTVGASAYGGAIFYNGAAGITITGTTFEANTAGAGGTTTSEAQGGALWVYSTGDASITGSRFTDNITNSSAGTNGTVSGGAIHVDLINDLAVVRSTFSGNEIHVVTPNGTTQAEGGALTVGGGPVFLNQVKVLNSIAEASGKANALSRGGGLWLAGSSTVKRSTISNNSVMATSGSNIATGSGGGIHMEGIIGSVIRTTVAGNSVAVESETTAQPSTGFGGGITIDGLMGVTSSTISGNSVTSTIAPSATSTVSGGGIAVSGSGATFNNSTISDNLLQGGTTPGVGTAYAYGAGLHASGTGSHLRFTTVAGNQANTTAATGTERGGGVYRSSGGMTFESSIVADNTSGEGGPDCYVTASGTTMGYNVIGDTFGCTFSWDPSDRTNVDPKLGALAKNGGPTRTRALAKSSPAVNLVPTSACIFGRDQRAAKRPQGIRCDSGSYELILR